jgi:hypothetical protein
MRALLYITVYTTASGDSTNGAADEYKRIKKRSYGIANTISEV